MYDDDNDSWDWEQDLIDQAGVCLDLARDGSAQQAITELNLLVQRETHWAEGARPAALTETEKLLDEALWYLRHADLGEAIYRLEQAVS